MKGVTGNHSPLGSVILWIEYTRVIYIFLLQFDQLFIPLSSSLKCRHFTRSLGRGFD